MDPRARADSDLIAQLESDRSQLTAHYQDLARFAWPDHAVLYRDQRQPEGDKRSQDVFDTTAPIAAERCGKMLKSMTAPSHRRYQKLAIEVDEIKDDMEVKRWLEHATDVIFRRRYRPGSGFDAQYLQGCHSLTVFGPIATLLEDTPEGNCYHGLSVSNTYFITNKYGRVCGLARRLSYNASQLKEKFGEDALPDKVKVALNAASQSQRLTKWAVVHVIEPLPEPQAVTGFTHASRYSLVEGYAMLEVRGYRGLPVAAARYSTMPGEDYGRSIAMLVMPTVKQLNKMDRDFGVGVHKQVDPPLLAFDDDGAMNAVKNVAGKVTAGGMSEDGKPLVAALAQPGRLDWAQTYMDEKRKQINDAFMTSLFQILASEQPRQQTAYEVSVREVEKSALLSPSTDNINDEYFTPLAQREIAIAMEVGDLEPMPAILEQHRDKIKITHTGDLSVAQQAEKVIGIQRALEVAPLFQAQDPSSTKRIKWADAYKQLCEGVGMSTELFNTDEELEEIRAQDEEQAMLAAAAELAPKAGQGAKNFAEAEQIRNNQALGLGFL
jgi:hypothetical protein